MLKLACNKQMNMFKFYNEFEELTVTSYKISHLLACYIKLYSDGEIMKQAIVTFAQECCSMNIQLKVQKLQLSNDIVTRRVKCAVEFG